MRDAYGPRRLKWALDWPVTIPRSRSVNFDPPVTIPSVKAELVVLGSAMVLVLARVIFHTALGF
jgi:hypothetical protein